MNEKLNDLIVEFEIKLKRQLRPIEIKVLEFLLSTGSDTNELLSNHIQPTQYLQ